MNNTPKNYLDINRHSWNQRTGYHLGSEFYDVPAFLKGKSTLNEPELALLGDVNGKKILHLQCHFGQDTLSLSRLGANVVGVDFSEVATDEARRLNDILNLNATFVCCDIYSLPDHLSGKFDVVFTSYGTIGWLPDLSLWAKVVAHFLNPGGKLIMADFHPVVWMFDASFNAIEYSYFNTGAIVEEVQGTYADRSAPLQNTEIGWNHSTSELLESLIHAGLQLEVFREMDYSPYNCFANMIEKAPGKFQIKGLEDKLPLMYCLCAINPHAVHV